MTAVYTAGWLNGRSGQETALVKEAHAAAGTASKQKGTRANMTDPKGTVADPYSYYPGTEPLGPGEIRIVACGTDMPAARR